jgi:hypothetical protein
LGQRGGLSTYPVAGVVNGLKLSVTGTGIKAGVGNEEILTVEVTAGAARFDGYRKEAAATLNVELDTGIDLTAVAVDAPETFQVWLNPKRSTPIFDTVAPAVTAAGTYALKGKEVDGGDIYGSYYLIDEVFISNGTAWEPMEAFKGFKQNTFGWNNLPFNEINLNAIATTDFALFNEKPVFYSSKLPPHVATYPKPMVRQSGGILLGEVTFTNVADTVTGAITKTMPEYYLLPV